VALPGQERDRDEPSADQEPGYAPVRLSAMHVNWCENLWKSYRIIDNSYQPLSGPRQACVSPCGGWARHNPDHQQGGSSEPPCSSMPERPRDLPLATTALIRVKVKGRVPLLGTGSVCTISSTSGSPDRHSLTTFLLTLPDDSQVCCNLEC
jgi:hypothetical protein